MGVLLFKGGVGVGMLKWQTSGGARQCARFFALTPSPSPTGRERGV
jgi:hypothetical protein